MALTITSIPAPFRPGLASIKRLPVSAFDQLVAALERAQIVGDLKNLTSAVLQQVPSLGQQEIEDILRALFSLSSLVADEDTPLSENISSLARAMQASGKPELELSESERAEFEKRLEKLVAIRTVVITSKVMRLRVDYPIIFHEASILTDMRPVFDNPEERPLGFSVSHTLRIAYHENGEHKEFFVILDDDDLGMMRKAIQRAEAKALSVRSLLKVSNLSDLS